MKEDSGELTQHRGMTAQKATEIHLRLQEIEAEQIAMRECQEELEKFMLAASFSTFEEITNKARSLLQLYATSHQVSDRQRQKLVLSVLEGLARLTE